MYDSLYTAEERRKLNDAVVEGPAATGDVLAVRRQEEG